MHSKLALWLAAATLLPAAIPNIVQVDTGRVKGVASGGVTAFKGIPFAAPPVGGARWKSPQPAPAWKGVREATQFGPRCMQGNIYNDMVFRDKGPSEDCLYLNVWTPATSAKARLPVMVWIYGGGFSAGAASEPRQDGENLAKKGVVVVSMNYRLGVFGFFAHADLAKESGHDSSGNYGLLDQVAALQWVHRNIDGFGGDPGKVTIFGESAGSFSVSALMASPLAQGLFQRAIGESGAFFATVLGLKTLAQSEEADAKFADSLQARIRSRSCAPSQPPICWPPRPNKAPSVLRRMSTDISCRKRCARFSPKANRATCRCWPDGIAMKEATTASSQKTPPPRRISWPTRTKSSVKRPRSF